MMILNTGKRGGFEVMNLALSSVKLLRWPCKMAPDLSLQWLASWQVCQRNVLNVNNEIIIPFHDISPSSAKVYIIAAGPALVEKWTNVPKRMMTSEPELLMTNPNETGTTIVRSDNLPRTERVRYLGLVVLVSVSEHYKGSGLKSKLCGNLVYSAAIYASKFWEAKWQCSPSFRYRGSIVASDP